jgi:hypothetical protein
VTATPSTFVTMLAPPFASLAVTAAPRVYWPAALPVQVQVNVTVAPPGIGIGAVALGTAPVLTSAAAVQVTPAAGVDDGVTAATLAAPPPAALASASDIVTGWPAAGVCELAVNAAVRAAGELMTTATGAARSAVTAFPVAESVPVADAVIEMFPA